MQISLSFGSEKFLSHPVSCLDDDTDAELNALIRRLMVFDVLIVPGLDGSGEGHWQSQWKKISYPPKSVRAVRRTG